VREQIADRAEAGRLLAKRLAVYGGRSDVVVLALPRGGVPVAVEIATALRAPSIFFWFESSACPDSRRSRLDLSR
jgi:predicted phosphoribosyltransferase